MKKILLSFLVVVTFICNIPMSVYASGTISNTEISGMTDHEIDQAIELVTIPLLHKSFGILMKPGEFDLSDYMSIWNDILVARDLITESESLEDFVRRSATGNIEDGIKISDEMTDILYDVTVEYIEQEKGWFDVKTQKFTDLNVSYFAKQSDYYSLETFFNSQDDDDVIWLYNTNRQTTLSGYDSNDYFTVLYVFDSDTQFFKYEKTNSYYKIHATKNWEYITDTWKAYNYNTKSLVNWKDNKIGTSSSPTQYYYNSKGSAGPYSRDGHTIRIYKSLDDLKSYSVGQRPYLAGEQFYNYDSSVDNSTTITQTTLDNSITYGDVYNYITNNYENPDSLSESQLMDILAEYLAQNSGNNGSSGSSGNSGSGGSSGTGLSGFLSGLGSLGDAILGILGKLIEYLGKAIDLVVNGISDIIEKIPQNVSGLIGALFPFLPEEFLTAIELALILGVVCIVAKMFK